MSDQALSGDPVKEPTREDRNKVRREMMEDQAKTVDGAGAYDKVAAGTAAWSAFANQNAQGAENNTHGVEDSTPGGHLTRSSSRLGPEPAQGPQGRSGIRFVMEERSMSLE